MTYSVAVSGASGYAGGEILRILAAHPDVEIRTVTAHSNAGQPLIQHQPHLRSLAHLTLQDTTPEVLAGHDIVFLALPHGQSGQFTDALQDTPLVIDAGADHRLESIADWDRFYGGDFHDPWTYGVPELPVAGAKQRERLVASDPHRRPGLQRLDGEPEPRSRCRRRSHRSVRHRHGARGRSVRRGQEPARRTCWRARSSAARIPTPSAARTGTSPRSARHSRPRGRRTDSDAADEGIRISFTPVLVPMSRGILATSTAPIVAGMTDADIRGAWEAAYGDETFVQLLPAGEFPRTADVLGANTALMGLAIDRAANRVVVVTAVDNLVKGTAGAAIQSMNIALGLAEGTALTVNGVAP